MCVTGACVNDQCLSFEITKLAQTGSCDYSVQCQSGLVCVDTGDIDGECQPRSDPRPRVRDPNDLSACSDDPTYATCGSPRSGSSEPGVRGGAGIFCNYSGMCATGVCDVRDMVCLDWNSTSLCQDSPCSYLGQCASGLECVDDGFGQSGSCQPSSVNNPRVCQYGAWVISGARTTICDPRDTQVTEVRIALLTCGVAGPIIGARQSGGTLYRKLTFIVQI